MLPLAASRLLLSGATTSAAAPDSTPSELLAAHNATFDK
ncbi:hypothetical protein BFJ69_g15786 [Fusarium oxysporum]|uniref:Uncharacterized protein n=1 Tax=Fusarium oxysporum TaxID=5507 RepID=A0A420MEU1_FUSOX|nr:hypothetical protein BFJ69_g15786 [Fusarium oxysporum]